MKNLVPYYYPTMAVLVDDSNHFLEGISFKLNDKLAYQLYDKPYQLLQFLKEEYQNHIKPISNIDAYNSENVWSQIYNKKKYNEISVILVDYSMPSINGLDFCRQLENSAIKKILVTGEADYEIAARAFNEGLIDKFIRKDDYDFAKKINEYIFAMQLAYFSEISHFKASKLADNFSFLKDPLFYEFFMHLFNDNQIVEFYFLADVKGFLLIDIDANLSMLLIRNEVELNENASNNQSIIMQNLNFINANNHAFLFPAKKIQAEKTYYYSLLKQEEVMPLDLNKIVPYRQYLGL